MAEGFEIFVPGRLCILGEHTDWAAKYARENPDIGKGFTLVCATNQGLHAHASRITGESVLEYQRSDQSIYKVALARDEIRRDAANGGFYSYIAGSALAILQSAKLSSSINSGIRIVNYSTNLPMKKGLSSSAAVCVLTVLAFQRVFHLDLTTAEIMELAYQGEMLTPSRCGRMDQCVVMGAGKIGLMEFNASGCTLQKLTCHSNLHFVVADLNAGKDTIMILRELNACFPRPQNEMQALMHEYVKQNSDIIGQAQHCIEQGDIPGLALAITMAQECFDRCAMPNCPSQLTSPRLHALMNDSRLQELSLAIKGVGAQGDGSAQILCSNEEAQELVLGFLKREYGMDGFALTVPGDQN